MNTFKASIKAEPISQEKKQAAIKRYKENELEKYKQFYNNEHVQKYFHHVIAAIMIVQNKYYEFHGINIPYRFKSPQSTSNKLDKLLNEATFSYDENNEVVVNLNKPILDALAMKVISRRRPPAFSSTDPEIRKLIEQKKKNQEFIEKMQEFKTHLIEDEYTIPENYKYKYECTKVDYYEKCKEILEHLKDLTDSNSTNLLAEYNLKILDINNRLEFLRATKAPGDPDEIVEYEDLTEEDINFFKILTTFENSVYNKTDLAILTKQFQSLFKNNKLFDSLGISLSERPMKEKRTENGFESNFVYIDTLFGTIECQLQTEDQYRSGNYGHAAHTKLKGKEIKPLPIPDVHDKRKINEFVQEINRICPKSFLARMDDNEPGRVMIQQFNDYQNYKNLISQVAKGDPLERYMRNYCAKLYSLRHKIFKSKENSMGFIDYDIDEYINSSSFKKLKKKVTQNKIENEAKRETILE